MQWGEMKRVRRYLTVLLGAALGASTAFAQEDAGVLTAEQVLESIENNGDYAITAAQADMDIARAKLKEAGAGLMPSLTLSTTAQVYRPRAHKKYPDDNREVYGKLEVVQPVYDFGQAGSVQDAAGRDAEAAEFAFTAARNTVLMEGLALYYDLHASELEMRALYEGHTSAYLKWDRAKENQALGRDSPIGVAEALASAEQTRLVFFRERTRNAGYRLRLEELMGVSLPEELISPPPPPKAKHADVDRDAFLDVVWASNPALLVLAKKVEAANLRREGVAALPNLDAFASTGYSTRDLRGRNDYAVGARLNWPIFDGGVTQAKKTRMAAEHSRVAARYEAKKSDLRRQAYTVLMERDDAYQRVLSALAQHDFTSKNLLRRQQLYSQERVSELGRAMIDHTGAEAELVRATGAYAMVQAKIAVMLGEHPGRGLDANFIAETVGVMDDTGTFVPKSGTGFGQDDADEFKRQDIVPAHPDVQPGAQPPAPQSAPVGGVESTPVN